MKCQCIRFVSQDILKLLLYLIVNCSQYIRYYNLEKIFQCEGTSSYVLYVTIFYDWNEVSYSLILTDVDVFQCSSLRTITLCLHWIYGSRYSRINQVRFVEGSLWKILFGSFLNTLTHMALKKVLCSHSHFLFPPI